MTDLEFLKLSKPQKLLHRLGAFFASIPGKLLNALKGLGTNIVKLFKGIGGMGEIHDHMEILPFVHHLHAAGNLGKLSAKGDQLL